MLTRENIMHRTTLLVIGAGLVVGALRAEPPSHPSGPAATRTTATDDDGPPTGPRGGRLLVDDDFALEIMIFERGVPPEFRVYAAAGGTAADLAEVDLRIELHRLGGRVDTFRFTPVEDHLRGDGVVEEPHSFDVTVVARRADRTHRWTYASHEGRTRLTAEAVENAGLVIETAGPATITTSLRLHGRIVPNQDREAHVIPRFPGIVTEVRGRLGDQVAAGDTLVVVQSNDSLQPYRILAPIDGVVVQKDVTIGEFVSGNRPIYVVSDLRTVSADLHAYRSDASQLALGQTALVYAVDDDAPTEGTLTYLSPLRRFASQTVVARVEIPNPMGRWLPGSFVTADVLVSEAAVPIAVKTSALQTFRDRDVVFIQEGDLFEVRPLELGRRDGTWVEVLAGLAAGQKYAAENSFILKADVGRSGATHDH